LVFQKKVAEAKKLLPQAYKILDKAAKTSLIKKNTAARKKSRITLLLSSAKPSETQNKVNPQRAAAKFQ
jgi:ribosomal protein S20